MSILDKKFLDDWVDKDQQVSTVLTLLEDMVQQSAEQDGNPATAKMARITYQQLATTANLVKQMRAQRDAN